MYIVHLKNGSAIKETDKDWEEVKKITNNFKDITSLQLQREGDSKCQCGRDISWSNLHTLAVKGENADVFQLKSAISTMGKPKPELVERVLGFYIKEGGEEKYAVKMIVDEKSGRVKLTLHKKINGKWIPQ